MELLSAETCDSLEPIHWNSERFAQNIFGEVRYNQFSCGFPTIFEKLQLLPEGRFLVPAKPG
jgi:hypothetical protein